MAVTWKKLAYEDDVVTKALFDAYSILAADTDNTPAAIALAASRLIGRKATGGIVALAKADILTIINVADGADVTGDNAPQAHAASHKNAGSDELLLHELGEPTGAVDFDLQQATDLVVMTVANEAALPAAGIALGQLCWATAELSVHICTAIA